MDERMTEEQILAEQERLNAIRDGTAGTTELNKELELMKAALGAVSKTAKEYTKAMADGKHGAKEFKGAIDLAGSAADGVVAGLTGLALMLAPLTAGMSLLILGVGAAASGAVKLGKEWAKASTDQADALYKTYQDLNKIGAAGSAGMTGIFRDMQNFGYNVKQLDQMVALVAANSRTLAQFGGIASTGTKRFAELSNEVRESEVGRKLLYAGNTIDDLNQAEVTYLKTLTTLGIQRTKTDRELVAGASALADNFDLLRRVTGDTLADQARKTVDMYSEDVYGQVISNLEAQGESGKENIKTLNELMLILPKELSAALRRSAGGRISPQDARIFSMNAELFTAVQQLSRNQKVGTTQEIYDRAQAQAREKQAMLGPSYALGIGKEISGQMRKEYAEFTGPGTYEERLAKARENQQLQDKTTEGMGDLMLMQMDATRALDTLVNVGINPTIAALKELAAVATAAYEAPGRILPDTFGAKGGSSLGPRSGGDGGPRRPRLNEAYDVLFSKKKDHGPLPPGVEGLLKVISHGEGTGDDIARSKGYKSGYDVTLGYGAYGGGPNEKPLTEMTLAEVKELQRKMLRHPSNAFNSSAVGKYQIVGKTLRGLQEEMGLKDTEKFSADLQDRMAEQLVQQAGLGGYVAGKLSPSQFQNRLARVWASIQRADTGRGAYANQPNAPVDASQIKSALDNLGVPTNQNPSRSVEKAIPINKTAEPLTKPAGPTQTYTPALKDIKAVGAAEIEKPAVSAPTPEMNKSINEDLFNLMKQSNSTNEAMLNFMRRTADNTGQILKQSK